MKKLQIIIFTGLSILADIHTLNSIDGCARGWHKNKERVCVQNSKKYIANVAKKDAEDAYESLTATLIQQSFIDQFNTLAAAGINNITNLQIPTISTSIIPFISNDKLVQFTAAQIPLFTVNQIPAFQPGQIAAFTPIQMASFPADRIKALVPAQIKALPINLLNITLANLSPAQIPALTKLQIQGLSFAQLGSIIPNIVMHQIEFITANQIKGLSPAAISLISENHINNMTAEQLTALKSILQNAAIITTSNNPNLGMQLSAIALAPGKGFTGDDAPPAKVKRKDDRSYIGSSLDKSTGLYQLNRATGVAASNALISRSLKKTNRKARKDLGIK